MIKIQQAATSEIPIQINWLTGRPDGSNSLAMSNS